MSDVPQDTTATAAESPATLGESRNELATGGTVSLPSATNEIPRERTATRQPAAPQKKLGLHRESVVKAIAKLNGELERLPEAEINKRLVVRGKIRQFEDQLGVIAEEQASLDREKDALARQEARARIDQYVKMRQQLALDGADVGDKIRQGLALVEKLYVDWKELRDRDRVAVDILRSLSPDQMTASPHFSWSSAVDGSFQSGLDQVLHECHRSRAEVARRGQAAT